MFLVVSFNLAGAEKINVVATYPYIADILQKIGGENIKVTSLASGDMDPHTITPRPSFIAKLRSAKLVVINGGQLEIGWLPPVLQQANNPQIIPGSNGFMSLMDFITPLEVNREISRAQGDVHPEGNPHIHLDPANILIFASAIKDKLSQLDKAREIDYQKNYEAFKQKWQLKTNEWETRLQGLKGKYVIPYHKLYSYFLHRFGIQSASEIEPLPGIPPSARHLAGLIYVIKQQHVELIIQDVYHSSQGAKFLKEKTGIPIVIIPHDIGAVKEAVDIFSLFDEIVKRLTQK